MGQFLDLTTADPDKVDFSLFSLDIYSTIVIYKTAFYSFYLPVSACALPWRATHASLACLSCGACLSRDAIAAAAVAASVAPLCGGQSIIQL